MNPNNGACESDRIGLSDRNSRHRTSDPLKSKNEKMYAAYLQKDIELRDLEVVDGICVEPR